MMMTGEAHLPPLTACTCLYFNKDLKTLNYVHPLIAHFKIKHFFPGGKLPNLATLSTSVALRLTPEMMSIVLLLNLGQLHKVCQMIYIFTDCKADAFLCVVIYRGLTYLKDKCNSEEAEL